MAAEDRWPPIHDFEGLIEYIDELAKTDALAAKLWSLADLQDQRLPTPCHGDVLESPLPSRSSQMTAHQLSPTTATTGW